MNLIFDRYQVPADYAALKGEHLRLVSLHEKAMGYAKHDIDYLREENKRLRIALYASKSETVKYTQKLLFNEFEFEAQAVAPENQDPVPAPKETEVKGHTRKPGGRKPLPANLPTEEVVHDLADENKICPTDGAALHVIGKEVSEELQFIPAQVKVIKHVSLKYGCRACEQTIVQAKAPEKVIPKSFASPSLLAHIAVAKYQDHLPLYRQEQMFKRLDIDLSRSTLAQWMIRTADILKPLVNQFAEDILTSEVIQCDETPVTVLKPGGTAVVKIAYMWVTARWGPKPIVVYDYGDNRSSGIAVSKLSSFTGYLQVDGYAGYNKVILESKGKIIRVACMAHIRRKFVDFLKTIPQEDREKHWTLDFLDDVRKLYAIEREIKDNPPEVRHTVRMEKSSAIITELKEWLVKKSVDVAPKSILGRAFAYALDQWPFFERYLEDGRCEIDNNLIENAIRPFALGKKNWLFCDTAKGADSSAILYSVMETAKRNGYNPEAYIKFVLENKKLLETADGIQTLLPYQSNDLKI